MDLQQVEIRNLPHVVAVHNSTEWPYLCKHIIQISQGNLHSQNYYYGRQENKL